MKTPDMRLVLLTAAGLLAASAVGTGAGNGPIDYPRDAMDNLLQADREMHSASASGEFDGAGHAAAAQSAESSAVQALYLIVH